MVFTGLPYIVVYRIQDQKSGDCAHLSWRARLALAPTEGALLEMIAFGTPTLFYAGGSGRPAIFQLML